MDQEKLDGLSIEELKTLRSNVDRAIASFERRRRDAARAAAEEAVRAHGMKLSDLLGDRAASRGKGANPTQKYANPDDATQTWSGRGRRPAWVMAALEDGRTLEDLAV